VVGKGRGRLLFVNKKKQKNFIYAGPGALALTQPEAQHNKSFCAAFFKKRLLACRRIVVLSQFFEEQKIEFA
jgi:hypothetical protein